MSSQAADNPLKRVLKVAFFVLVNLWLVFHVAAIIVAPASVPPSSPLVQSTWDVFKPYLETLYLNHGYHYFASEPGPSTLLGYSVQRSEGPPVTGRIPNRDIEPRLLYHRHFMLTEFLPSARSRSEDFAKLWHRSYAEHLCAKHGGNEVTLAQIGHLLPTMEMIKEGAKLDDPRSFEEQPLGNFPCKKP